MIESYGRLIDLAEDMAEGRRCEPRLPWEGLGCDNPAPKNPGRSRCDGGSNPPTYQEGLKMPERIQRKRTKGWKMPPNTVYVGRGTQWGNPYVIGRYYVDSETHEWVVFDRDGVIELYKNLFDEKSLGGIRRELRGKNLCCWCALDQPCHADWLLEIANSSPTRKD
jgi:hypothetical protein